MLEEIRQSQHSATTIVVVPGNGEYVDQELDASRARYRAAVDAIPNTAGSTTRPSCCLAACGSSALPCGPTCRRATIGHYSEMLAATGSRASMTSASATGYLTLRTPTSCTRRRANSSRANCVPCRARNARRPSSARTSGRRCAVDGRRGPPARRSSGITVAHMTGFRPGRPDRRVRAAVLAVRARAHHAPGQDRDHPGRIQFRGPGTDPGHVNPQFTESYVVEL